MSGKDSNLLDAVLDEHFGADADGFVQSLGMDGVRDYVMRGRIFGALSDAALVGAWGPAVRSVDELLRRPSPGLPQRMQCLNDLRAEFALRRQPPPLHLVEREWRSITDHLALFLAGLGYGSTDPKEGDDNVSAAYREYMAARDAPPN